MRVITIVGKGGPEVLHLAERAEPSPGPDQLLVRVKTSALNRADLLQALGQYPAPPGFPPDVPGLEYAGVVEAVGPRVQRHKVGDRVMGILGGGAFSEALCVNEREAMAIPVRMDFTDAAAIPEAFLTAFDAIVTQGGLRPSDSLLVHAATSGVGTAAIQLGRVLSATVLGTGRSKDKLERARALGLQHALPVEGPPSFSREVTARSGGRGADVVVDLVGAAYLAETLRSMARRGRLIQVGLLGGAKAEIDLSVLMTRRLTLRGTTLRGRPLDEKIAVAQTFEREMLPFFATKALQPVVDSVLPFSEIREAARRMQANKTFGKVVLSWP